MANQQLAASDLDACIEELEAKYSELVKHNSQLQAKVLNPVARSWTHNIKIVGIQEGEEDCKLTELVSKLIPKLLREHIPHPVKVDHACFSRSQLPVPTCTNP